MPIERGLKEIGKQESKREENNKTKLTYSSQGNYPSTAPLPTAPPHAIPDLLGSGGRAGQGRCENRGRRTGLRVVEHSVWFLSLLPSRGRAQGCLSVCPRALDKTLQRGSTLGREQEGLGSLEVQVNGLTAWRFAPSLLPLPPKVFHRYTKGMLHTRGARGPRSVQLPDFTR